MPYVPKMPIEDSPWVKLHDPEDVKEFIEYVQSLAEAVVDLLGEKDSHQAGSMMRGALQALERYNKITRASVTTRSSSFRFSDAKERGRKVAFFLIPDPSRMKAQKKIITFIQNCAIKEFKRHPNTDVNVQFIAEEATNFKIEDLKDLLTSARAYGIRLYVVIQDFSAFEETYGEKTFKTLLGETEIKLFLPGQRNPQALSMLESMLGREAVMMQTRSGRIHSPDYVFDGHSYAEDGKAVRDSDQIRRTDKGFLFIRRCRAIEVDLPPYAEIHPVRDVVAPNPMHGNTPFKRPVSVWLNGDEQPSFKRAWKDIKRVCKRIFGQKSEELHVRRNRYFRRAKLCWFFSQLLDLWWLAALAYVAVFTDIPRVLWYSLQGGL